MGLKKLLLILWVANVLFLCEAFPSDPESKKIKKYFKMDLYQLLKVEVTTAGKKREKIKNIPASVIVLSREDIETYGYQSLPEILESIPGLYITDDYINLYTGIRGFWSINPNRNMIILVNGIPIKDALSALYYLETLPVPVEAIDRIEVVRGPMSVIYGNGAFFGVINIITNQLNEKDRQTMASVSLGSNKTSKIFARAAGRKSDFQYVFNGSFFKTAGLNVPLDKIGDSIFSGLTTRDKLERTEKYFNFSGTFSDFSFDFSYAENQKEMMFLFPPVSDGTQAMYNDFRLRAKYKRKLSNILTIESKLYYFLTKLSADYDMLFPDFYGKQENCSLGFKGELNLFINPSPNLSMTIGVDYSKVFRVSSQFMVPFLGLNLIHYRLADGESMVTQSIFSQMDYKISNRLNFVAGVMLEQTPDYTLEKKVGDHTFGNSVTTQAKFSYPKVELIPRLALIYSINENNVIKVLYGKAINRPSFFNNLDLLAVPNLPLLKPETIHTFELNYIAQISPKVILTFSFFRNLLDHLIYRTIYSEDDSVYLYYSNLGEMNTNGLEMSAYLSPTKNFHFELSGTYQDTKDKRPGFENIEVAYSPKFLAYLNASYFFNKQISMAVNANYVDEMQTFWDDTLPIPDRLGEKVKGYLLVGANMRIRNIFKSGMFLNFRVSNLFNNEFHYPTTAGNNLFANKGTIGGGRTFLLTVGWEF